MRVALLFDHFGPYHQARLRAAAERLDVTGVECRARSRDYAWDRIESAGLPLVTIPAGNVDRSAKATADLTRKLEATLSELNPDVVAIPGWSSPEALTALQWCLKTKVPAVLMSESCAHDEQRRADKEWVKRRIVALFSAGLAGGSAHRSYLEALGMKAPHIFLGYDAVDNAYFKAGADRARAAQAAGTSPRQATRSFLASARFIEKKNLTRLLDAYAAYRLQTNQPAATEAPWTLTLLGDGPLRVSLESQVRSLGLEPFVSMPGFLQYEDLPRYYAHASAFIHASTTEQWGLVVNEAMASGLPVMVSNRCGCAPDLVHKGVNGFTFDPYDTKAIAAAMVKMTALTQDERADFCRSSQSIIRDWGPERFGRGIEQAAACARNSPLRPPSVIDKALLALLLRR
jgi:1,2-diacylglycerol 3-alpha-glucosyltransferase